MKENTIISVKIAKLIELSRCNTNEFAKRLGYSRSQVIYDILNGKSKPSFDFFQKLFNSEFSELVNPAWLFTTDGEMEIKTIPDSPAKHQNNEIEDLKNKLRIKDEMLDSLQMEKIKAISDKLDSTNKYIAELEERIRVNFHKVYNEMEEKLLTIEKKESQTG